MCKCSKISSPIMSHFPPFLHNFQKGHDSLRAPNAPLACSVRKTPRAVPQPAVAKAPVLQMVITRAAPSRPAAWEPWEIMGNHGNHRPRNFAEMVDMEFHQLKYGVFMGFDGIKRLKHGFINKCGYLRVLVRPTT